MRGVPLLVACLGLGCDTEPLPTDVVINVRNSYRLVPFYKSFPDEFKRQNVGRWFLLEESADKIRWRGNTASLPSHVRRRSCTSCGRLVSLCGCA